jgi:hypothetical protein
MLVSACAGAHVAFVTQQLKRMLRIILSSAVSLAPPRFSTLSHKQHDSREELIKHKMCVSLFSKSFC